MSKKKPPVPSKRPSLEILQESTNSYFRRNPPKVQWRKLDRHGRHVAGMAVLKRNRIYLHPEMTRDSTGCMIALDFYIPKTQLRLREGEEYFQTLLHEIGHFKIKKGHGYKMPAEYKKVERLLRKEHPATERLNCTRSRITCQRGQKKLVDNGLHALYHLKRISMATLLKIMDMLKTGQGLSSRENEKKLLRCYKSKI
jgi:hypothetical protein